MTIQAVTFDRMPVTAADDALLNYLGWEANRIIRGYAQELKVTSSGLTVTVMTGGCIIFGRLIKVTESERLTLPANKYGYVVVEVDLGAVNTSTGTPGTPSYVATNGQVKLKIVENLVQQDLLNSGQVYQFPIATWSTTASTASVGLMRNQPKNMTDLSIVDFGSTSNGFYTMFGDGLLVQYASAELASGISKPFGAIFRSESAKWTFPVPFKHFPPSISYSINTNHAYSWCGMGESTTDLVKCHFSGFSAVSFSEKPVVGLAAIGRWK